MKCERTGEECSFAMLNKLDNSFFCELESILHEPCPNPNAYAFVDV